jgi:acetyltransferase-like isoleucine patch superfamily enzyme
MLIKRDRLPIKQIITIGILPSFLKRIFYKCCGHKIGATSSIGFGSVIIGEKVEIGDHTSIGFLTIIRGRKVQIGSHVNIGSMSFIDTHEIKIGDGAKINEQVFIGGMDSPESKFDLGKNTIVMQLTYINTAKPVTIGDDSGIGGHCIIFTHGSWLNIFEGYPAQFAPVNIGKSVWLPWRVFVMPGSNIGDGSVIGANSLVSGEIPPKSLAVGSPAKVIKTSPAFPKTLTEKEKRKKLEEIVNLMCDYLSFFGVSNDKRDCVITFSMKSNQFSFKKKHIKMFIDYSPESPLLHSDHLDKINLIIRLYRIDELDKKTLCSKNIAWFDIEKKERSIHTNDLADEAALFLTRYGLRMTFSE